MKKKVVVIGGGIIGLSSAYYLHKEGHKVTVIDQTEIIDGASFVNAGYITPSHFIPLAAPGMIRTGIKYMFDATSPFYMKPRLDLDFMKWAFLFAKSCSKKNVAKAMQPILDINLFGQKMFKEIKASKDFDFHLEHKGLLLAFQETKTEMYETEIASKSGEMGLHVERIDKERLRTMEPNLIAKGAFFYKSDSHTTPSDFMHSMKEYLKKNEVVFQLKEEVLDIKSSNKQIEIRTDKARYNFDEVVIATGSWTDKIAKKLHQYIPIQAGKGYAINSLRPSGIQYPTILSEAKVAVTPMDGFTRFAGTMELSGIDNSLQKKRIKAITNTAKQYYKNFTFNEQEIAKATFGFRPVSPDGMPFIGRLDKNKKVTIATGHAMMGWSLGPATGKLVSEIISAKRTSINLEPFSVQRFG